MYLNGQGYSELQIGTAMTSVSVMGILSPSIFGYLADRVIPIKGIALILMLISIPIAFVLGWTVSVVPLAIISITALGLTERSMMSVIDSWGMKIRESKPYLNYGLNRGIASLAYALAGLLLGRYYSIAGIEKMFWVHGAFAMICAGAAALLDNVPVSRPHKSSQSFLHTIGLLLKNKVYVLLLICMTLHGFSIVTIQTFQPILVATLGGTSAHLGAVIFVMAASEAPFMFSSAHFLRNFKVERLLQICFLFAALRILSGVLAPTINLLIASQAFQAVSYGLYLPCVLYYISAIVPRDVLATAITLATSMGFGLSGILGNVLGGFLAQQFGIRTVYYVFTLLAVCAFIIFSIGYGLRNRSQQTGSF